MSFAVLIRGTEAVHSPSRLVLYVYGLRRLLIKR